MCLRRAARDLHIPPRLSPAERLDALAAVRPDRDPRPLVKAAEALPERRCSPRKAALVAWRFHTWREEIRRGDTP